MTSRFTAHPRHLVNPTRPYAWHGWRLELPVDWNPVRIDGDDREGKVLFADLDAPRLGLRWSTPRRLHADWATQALIGELGRLAADEATPLPLRDLDDGHIYLEPAPPGRDVFVGRSRASGRVVELVLHTTRRGRDLADHILPTLRDDGLSGERTWAIYDLSCRTPAGYRLTSRRLNAGDLALSFAGRASFATFTPRLTVRQIAVASLALTRRPIEDWLKSQQYARKRYFRLRTRIEPFTLTADDGRTLAGVERTVPRRRRYAWAWRVAPSWTTLAMHDTSRDRLIVVESDKSDVALRVCSDVGATPP